MVTHITSRNTVPGPVQGVRVLFHGVRVSLQYTRINSLLSSFMFETALEVD